MKQNAILRVMIYVYISKHVYIKSIIYAKELFAYYMQSI